jgi:FMN-dependent oxidoreductase (nitrilotriacetate monooxygenase family)
MSKPIRFNAFEMNCVGHQSPGLWRHPRDRSAEYTTLAYWTDLARIAERGLFDGIFLADVVGVYDVFGGTPDAALRHGAQVPVNDPLLLVPAMAVVTEHLGFGVTCNLTYEAPYLLARRFSTLDHLTGGRIGWNVVTGYLDSAARAMGFDRQRAHDDRYAVAEEYMEIVGRLWRDSWDGDAVVRDRASGTYVDPSKVRAIRHQGPHYQLEGIHLSEPSPQRSPVIYQAGTSPKGRAFAGRHAECVFVSGPSEAVIAPRVAALRADVAAAGRDPSGVLVYAMATIIWC